VCELFELSVSLSLSVADLVKSHYIFPVSLFMILILADIVLS
jgi:hypothetical protein